MTHYGKPMSISALPAARDTPTPAGLTPEQAHTYHERAGIMEYDGHLPRQMAEAVALAGVRRANPTGLRCAGLDAHKQNPVVGGP